MTVNDDSGRAVRSGSEPSIDDPRSVTPLAGGVRRSTTAGEGDRPVEPRRTGPPPPPLTFLCQMCWSVFDERSARCPTCQHPPPPAGWSTLPFRFRDRFLFTQQAGRGGMGAVFLAVDELARPEQAGDPPALRAVKVVQRVGDPEAQRLMADSFTNEAGAAALLGRSESFVRVLGHEVTEPPYLAMEYVEWPTMQELVDRAPLPSLQVARLGIALLQGIARMHRYNIVHRDLKPSNVFFTRIDQEPCYAVKIADLGTWVRDQDRTGVTSTGQLGVFTGTLSYMSPEQSLGLPVGARSDLHSIGSLLWRLADGEVPFEGEGPTLVDRIHDRNTRLREPPARPERMPEGLYEVLVKALAYAPKDRFANADEMSEALSAFVQSAQDQRESFVIRFRRRVGELEEQYERIKQRIEAMSLLRSNAHVVARRIEQLNEMQIEADPAAMERAAAEVAGALAQLEGELLRLLSGDGGRPDSSPARRRRWLQVLGALVSLGLGLVAGLALAPRPQLDLGHAAQRSPQETHHATQRPTSRRAGSPAGPGEPGKASSPESGEPSAASTGAETGPEAPPLVPSTKPAESTAEPGPLQVEVVTEPPGARVFFNGQRMCARKGTPCTLTFEGGGPFEIELRNDYCRPFVRRFADLRELQQRGLPRPVVLELKE